MFKRLQNQKVTTQTKKNTMKIKTKNKYPLRVKDIKFEVGDIFCMIETHSMYKITKVFKTVPKMFALESNHNGIVEEVEIETNDYTVITPVICKSMKEK